MSGHSHAKTIKHDKNIADQKRGAAFSKMVRVITVAVKEGGTNPETNTRLRMALEAAKGVSMPKENVERAIARASGADESVAFAEFLFEAYGPGNIAILIEGITDNRNRAFNDVKMIINQNNGKLVGEGAIRWMFDRLGIIIVELENQSAELKNKEALELLAIEAGATDICWYENTLEVRTSPETLETVKKAIETKGAKVDSYSVSWIAKEEVEVDEKAKEQYQKLFDALNENDSVQEVYSNLKE